MNDDEDDDLSISFASSLNINEFLIDNKKDLTAQLEQQCGLNQKSSQLPLTNMESINTSQGKESLPKQRIQHSGEYSKKRSMSMESIADIWSKGVSDVKHDNKVEGRKSGGKGTVSALLDARFKKLPDSLGNRYTVVKGVAKSVTQRMNEDRLCTVEPSRIYLECQMKQNVIYSKIAHITLKNMSSDSIRKFSLFSANGMLEFDMIEGVLLEHEELDVKIRIKPDCIKQQDQQTIVSDKLLVLVDQIYPTTIDVSMHFMKSDQDYVPNTSSTSFERPKCPYCALEKGFPLHCL
ncbi:uncharacterized protein RHIMIDRAFT_310748 [Rhizopus microsporus ATCC 52813]|uniref:Uncharacterized protein n=1 Tax=Rhizopus microsporus ATCC 52813 TaxID=1340429 RepID=A0A2G4T543_RHIZD|nr:uncharacterized protein RHIMIDRAFT_310748 [Rhizopus microsporus ATCC 52813]PHZ16132.1 hypothetical protein RHIMIDRAFT_310748 [Rhizopus microsporus ATCC 52813]